MLCRAFSKLEISSTITFGGGGRVDKTISICNQRYKRVWSNTMTYSCNSFLPRYGYCENHKSHIQRLLPTRRVHRVGNQAGVAQLTRGLGVHCSQRPLP